MVSNEQGRYSTRYLVLGGSGRGSKWWDDLVVEVVKSSMTSY